MNVLHDVERTGPLNQMSPQLREAIWQEADTKLAGKVNGARKKSEAAPASGKGLALWPLTGVPLPPPRYVPRYGDLNRLEQALAGPTATEGGALLGPPGWASQS